MVPGMKIIAINAGSSDHGDFVVESLRTAREQGRLTYDDTALVTKEAEGKIDVQHHRTHHFHRRGIDDSLLQKIGSAIGAGEAVVLVLGPDADMDAVAARVLDLTGDDMPVYEAADGQMRRIKTEDVGSYTLADGEGLLREAAVDLPEQEGMLTKMPYS
jgi:hypothetical protein